LEDLEADMNIARPIVAGGTGATTAAAARLALLDTGGTLPWDKGSDVASANALTLGSDGNYFDITGTTAITSIATKGVGQRVLLQFDGILVLTHHATDLVLPGGKNITTAAGDHAEFVEYASGDWRLSSYTSPASIRAAWEHIATTVVSGATATVDYTNLSAYRMLRLTGHVIVATDAARFTFRSSTDNGSNYDAGASDYTIQVHDGTSTTTQASVSNESSATLIAALGNAANEVGSFVANIFEFNQARQMQYISSVNRLDTTTATHSSHLVGRRTDSTARNAIRLIPSSGDIAAGSFFVLEGVRG
jgi:hypothetical protein